MLFINLSYIQAVVFIGNKQIYTVSACVEATLLQLRTFAVNLCFTKKTTIQNELQIRQVRPSVD